MKESKIQKDTLKLLAANDYLAFPFEFRNQRGAPDLMVFQFLHPAKVAFVELKTKHGRRSEIQIRTGSCFEVWGHNVGVCRTPDEALAHVQKVFNGETNTQVKNDPENLRDRSRPESVSRVSHADKFATW